MICNIPAIGVTASVIAGILVSNTRFATERFWVKSYLPLRLAATAVMSGLLYWMIPLGVSAAREDLHLKRAERQPSVDEHFFEEFYCRDLKCQAEIDTIWDIKKTLE